MYKYMCIASIYHQVAVIKLSINILFAPDDKIVIIQNTMFLIQMLANLSISEYIN